MRIAFLVGAKAQVITGFRLFQPPIRLFAFLGSKVWDSSSHSVRSALNGRGFDPLLPTKLENAALQRKHGTSSNVGSDAEGEATSPPCGLNSLCFWSES